MKNSFNELSYNELKDKRAELKKRLHDLRFEVVTGHLENPLEMRNVKRQIARINTIVTEYDRGIRGGA